MNGTALVRYDAACHALAVAKSVDEVKEIRDASEAMRAYARQAQNKQLETDAAEIRIRAERRLGELLRAQKETVGLNQGAVPGKTGNKGAPVLDPRPTLAEAGITKKLSSRAQKLAAVPAEEFELEIAGWRQRIEEENDRVSVTLEKAGEKHIRGTFGTGENEWYTPAVYVDAARSVLGSIDLDPASSAQANEVIRADEYFDIQRDGLALEWAGRVWMNPPYAQPFIERFVRKLAEEYASGRVTSAIALTHNYTDTAWFHCAAAACAAICFTKGRIRFEGANGEVAAPTQGQAFFYLGQDVDLFRDTFAQFGFVVTP